MKLKKKLFTFEDWNSHCDKFLPPQITTFVKIQAQLHK